MSTDTQNESKLQVGNGESQATPPYIPSPEEIITRNQVLRDFMYGRTNSDKEYNQFNGRNLYDFIDDGTKRWNGYIPESTTLLDSDQSRIFLNFTRNQIISYLAKAAMSRVMAKIKAVNKKTGMLDQRFSDVLSDCNSYSLNAENGDAQFLRTALETATKGTAIVYESYRKETQVMDVPFDYNVQTGELKVKKQDRLIYDDCCQELLPLEDFYIANPYEPDIQKQPFIVWRKTTTYLEAARDFAKYPNWKYVKPGMYIAAGDVTTFYRERVYTDLAQDQVEIIRHYNRKLNAHAIVVNGIVLYDGPIPFKDGLYPFAKYIFEPFDNFFFWGSHFPNKIMGEQDEMNTYINMMNDKTYGSLLPYGLSSDLDDLIEDDVLQVNKIRKVGDINKWKFDTLPGVSGGEMNMFQLIMNLARENSGDMSGAGNASTPRGGKLPVRQVLLKQQESMQKLSFNINGLEDGERDRTVLRVNHILQFYSIPKIEKITGVGGRELEQLVYRDIRVNDIQLSDGRWGTKVIKLTDDLVRRDPMKKAQMEDDLSVIEVMGEEMGQPTEALAVSVDTFYDYNIEVQIVKNSSYEKNQVLDQALRHEYANWRLGLLQFGVPVNAPELVKWVDESYDIDSERFDVPEGAGAPTALLLLPGANPGAGGGAPAEDVAGGGKKGPAAMVGAKNAPEFGEEL